jgi:predicted dehydrogenase
MMPESPGDPGSLNRRQFLAAGAVPVTAALTGMRTATVPSSRSPRTGDVIRVGLIGAGENVRDVMIPGFRRIPQCQLLAVANTSLESSRRVAEEFDIPRAYANWRELLQDEDIDAVCIGTWPYVHRAITVASLESGKHVLCQARMANDAAEAREMLEVSRRYPHLVSQLVPTSSSYAVDNVLMRLINEGLPGEVLSVEVQRLQRAFADFAGELDWRHDDVFSGLNSMNLGATYESMMRWLGRGNRVMAMAKVHVPFRRGRDGRMVSVAIPDHVDVLYELANGAQVHMRFSESTGLSAGNQTWIHGTEGTIHVDGRNNVFAGRRGDAELAPIPNPPEEQAVYRVEEEFINAIRGLEPVTMATFETGVHYMEWTEAVHRSAQTGQAVYLPL